MLFEATVWGERVSFPSCHKMKCHEKSFAPFLRTLIWKQLAMKNNKKQIELYRWEPGQLALDVVQLGLGTLNGHLTLAKELENYLII